MKYLAILHGVNEGELEIECQPLRQLSTLPMDVALDQKYVPQDIFDRIYLQADKVGKMDSNLITYLRESDRHYTETRKCKKTK